MGIGISRALALLFGLKRDVRLLMVGLDASGKTTLLFKLKLGEVVATIPTMGFNVETVDYKHRGASISFTICDVGGPRPKMWTLWRQHFLNTQGLIFVVDSSDGDRMDEAKDDLHRIMAEDEFPRGVALLVLANKQDMPGAMTSAEVTEQLGLQNQTHCKWFVQNTCALTGEGVHEGFDWLTENISDLAPLYFWA